MFEMFDRVGGFFAGAVLGLLISLLLSYVFVVFVCEITSRCAGLVPFFIFGMTIGFGMIGSATLGSRKP